ncbi:MAG: hypothetical protein A3D56_02940 [Candidatus Taylorbacteria bacterium RIFCSPHIGHO2_02_FULL_45_35]|uniref:Magnesium transporter CorA n=1 Tax=Candidatus Taylorbacteria bacterium RIFCSPHIGHO2_02_FULL_45_35 TaxID=1802311 RepID=A0A1G2MSG8_9BACT|nr:MAG: hypothetical protein A3D56_02940 [Candidatus Taylorbacteria bacterium RIFCSPHIGHO2_02_FULL_45_35]
MIKTYTYKKVTWVDVEKPSEEEIRSLISTYGIPPTVAEELTKKSLRSKVDVYQNALYLAFQFPETRHRHEKNQQEIDFIIGKQFVITVRHEAGDALHEFSKLLEVGSILDKRKREVDGSAVFFSILMHLYQKLQDELINLHTALEHIENNIFARKEKEMVVAISEAARRLIDFKKATRFHKSILLSLASSGTKFFGEEFCLEVETLIEEYYKIDHLLLGNSETLSELRETNNSLLSTRENEIIRRLTLMAFITFPLMLITSIFGMDIATSPILSDTRDFSIVIGIMATLTIVMLIFFKHKKWL